MPGLTMLACRAVLCDPTFIHASTHPYLSNHFRGPNLDDLHCRRDRAAQLSYGDLDSFPWATAVVKESLRMWPTVTPQLGLQRCDMLTSRRICTHRCNPQHRISPRRQ